MKKFVIGFVLGFGIVFAGIAGCATLEQLFGKPCLTAEDCPGDGGPLYEEMGQPDPGIPPMKYD